VISDRLQNQVEQTALAEIENGGRLPAAIYFIHNHRYSLWESRRSGIPIYNASSSIVARKPLPQLALSIFFCGSGFQPRQNRADS
jgi:hypothetical protein